VKWTFEVMDRIGGVDKNAFIHSLREQYDHGRGLSPKQFAILARTVGENASALPDCDAVRAKLAEFVTGGFTVDVADPAIPELLQLMKGVQKWRPASKKGRKVYDDQAFVESLREQFERRHSLSPRQLVALRRVVVAYRAQIPDYERQAAALGLKDMPSSDEKSAEVIA